jgi:hypothetical protein
MSDETKGCPRVVVWTAVLITVGTLFCCWAYIDGNTRGPSKQAQDRIRQRVNATTECGKMGGTLMPMELPNSSGSYCDIPNTVAPEEIKSRAPKSGCTEDQVKYHGVCQDNWAFAVDGLAFCADKRNSRKECLNIANAWREWYYGRYPDKRPSAKPAPKSKVSNGQGKFSGTPGWQDSSVMLGMPAPTTQQKLDNCKTLKTVGPEPQEGDEVEMDPDTCTVWVTVPKASDN